MDHNKKTACSNVLGAEVLMVIISFIIMGIGARNFYNFLMSFTNYRKKLSDKAAGIFLTAANSIFLPVMSYLFSQDKIYDPEGRARIILVWMVLIEFIQVRSDSQWGLQKSADQLMRLLWVCSLVFDYTRFDLLRIILLFFCVISITYEVLKGVTSYKAKNSYLLDKNPKVVHNYMKRVMLNDDLRTTPMNACAYVVMGEENHEIRVCENGYILDKKKPNSDGIVTVGRVFELTSSQDAAFTSAHPDWREICLSFSLAKMLRRRFIFPNLPLDEAGNSKARDFVLEGLIDFIGRNNDTHTGGIHPVERLFKIIQDEIKFVSDIVHTKVPSYLLGHLVNHEMHRKMHTFSALILIQVQQDIHSGDVTYHLYYVEQYFGKSDGWKTNQGSAVESKLKKQLSRKHFSVFDTKAETIFSIGVHGTIIAPLVMMVRREIKKAFPSIFHSTDVKEAILMSLKTKLESGGQLTNGEYALRTHGVWEHLNPFLEPSGSTTEAIFVWHIATALFHHGESAPQQNSDPFNPKEKEVALALSSYCYYLVVYLPELLPDEVEWTEEEMYESVRKEIFSIDRSSGQKPTAQNRCDYLMRKDDTWDGNVSERNIWSNISITTGNG